MTSLLLIRKSSAVEPIIVLTYSNTSGFPCMKHVKVELKPRFVNVFILGSSKAY